MSISASNVAEEKNGTRPSLFRRGAGGEEQLSDMLRPLTAKENDWKIRIYSRLLDVMDLSLIGTLPEKEARSQIRELSGQLEELQLHVERLHRE